MHSSLYPPPLAEQVPSGKGVDRLPLSSFIDWSVRIFSSKEWLHTPPAHDIVFLVLPKMVSGWPFAKMIHFENFRYSGGDTYGK